MKSYQQRVPSSVCTYKQRHTLWRDHTLAPDPNPGVQSAALKPWRDTLARWLSVLSLFICTVCRFSWRQWQAVRRVFGNLT